MSETKYVIDPVCGMKVDPAKAAGSSNYQGKTYHFCGAGCEKAFNADPEKYLAGDGNERSHHRHH